MIEQNIFKEALSPEITKHLEDIGYKTPTPIQQQTLPSIIEKKDIIARANTGSGKTLSFALGVLNNYDKSKFEIQSLVLCPTRELANQVALEIRKVMKVLHNVKVMTICGGVPYKPQVHSLSHKAHIIVGTPGRVLKHLENDNFKTDRISTLVLDEADRMLDMGFLDDVKKIIEAIPKQRQTLLFSATYPEDIENLANNFMNKALKIDITQEQKKPKINEIFYKSDKKELDVKQVLDLHTPTSSIIFCNRKIECDELADYLESQDIYPLVLHSDLDQRQRDETLVLFENKSYKILICTDVASRGLDIDNVELVINHALPREHAFYTHRIGRTARNEKTGTSVSLIDNYQENFIEEYNEDATIETMKIPSSKYNDQTDYVTLLIFAGKKQKLRRGDVVGSLVNEYGFIFDEIGTISQKDKVSYVALKEEKAKKLKNKEELKIKGKWYHYKYIE